MFNLETRTETVVKRVVVLTLNEDDIAKILVDPRGLQKQLRVLKGQWRKAASPANNWSATGAPKAPKKKGRGRSASHGERKAIDRVACVSCGEMIAAYRQGRHKCKGANAD